MKECSYAAKERSPDDTRLDLVSRPCHIHLFFQVNSDPCSHLIASLILCEDAILLSCSHRTCSLTSCLLVLCSGHLSLALLHASSLCDISLALLYLTILLNSE